MLSAFWVELIGSLNAQFVKWNKVCPFDKLVPKNKQIFLKHRDFNFYIFRISTKP